MINAFFILFPYANDTIICISVKSYLWASNIAFCFCIDIHTIWRLHNYIFTNLMTRCQTLWYKCSTSLLWVPLSFDYMRIIEVYSNCLITYWLTFPFCVIVLCLNPLELQNLYYRTVLHCSYLLRSVFFLVRHNYSLVNSMTGHRFIVNNTNKCPAMYSSHSSQDESIVVLLVIVSCWTEWKKLSSGDSAQKAYGLTIFDFWRHLSAFETV